MPLLCDVCPKDMKLVCSNCNFARYCSHECLEHDTVTHMSICDGQPSSFAFNVGAKQKKKVQKTSEWILENGNVEDFSAYADSLRHMFLESFYKNGERTNATTVFTHTEYDQVKDLMGICDLIVYFILNKLSGRSLKNRRKDFRYQMRMYIENMHIISGEAFDTIEEKTEYIKTAETGLDDILQRWLISPKPRNPKQFEIHYAKAKTELNSLQNMIGARTTMGKLVQGIKQLLDVVFGVTGEAYYIDYDMFIANIKEGTLQEMILKNVIRPLA